MKNQPWKHGQKRVNPLKRNETGRARNNANPKAAPKLDGRLNAAFSMVPPCEICADIGADHGKLSAALLQSGRAKYMLVADVSEKALEKARKLLGGLGLAKQATFAVADGLSALSALTKGSADVICMLGMGGDTLAGILKRGRESLGKATLIVGAQTELPRVRQRLVEIGYRLREEQIAEVSNRLYVLLCATPAMEGEASYTERELLLGPYLLQTRPLEWLRWLAHRAALLEKATKAMCAAGLAKDLERLNAAQKELLLIRKELRLTPEKGMGDGNNHGSNRI